MSTLARWADEGATAEELRLIEASRCERADSGARVRTLVALGVGGGFSNGSSNGWSTPARPAPGWRGWMATKVSIVAVCGVGAIAGSAWFASARRRTAFVDSRSVSRAVSAHGASSPPGAPIARESASATFVDPPSVGPAAAAERPAPTSMRRSLRRLVSASPHRSEKARVIDASREPPAGSPHTTDLPRGPSTSTLSAEVAALDRAHAALAVHDPAGALRLLDRYRASFPSGKLAAEETVLRVQALLARGDHQAAGAVADRFFAGHPDSSYARRVRDLLHDSEESGRNE